MPQFAADGSNAAAVAYLALLAETYDALKAGLADLNVIGGSLVARGSDDPAASRQTHSPTTLHPRPRRRLPRVGPATPVMDMFSLHPYPENSSIPPTSSTRRAPSIGLADYDKLVDAARRGVRRHRPAGLVAADRLRRVRPADDDPAEQERRVLRRRAGADEADRRGSPGERRTRRRSASPLASRPCGCCSSSTSPTSRSSSAFRQASTTPTTRRRRAWNASPASPVRQRTAGSTASAVSDYHSRTCSSARSSGSAGPREVFSLRARE